ncbi:MAG TPA: ParB/RepB/Spo0J family partition protein [Alloacidobacterium sp.]|nr:ParB/RepB/Spo0J family partition protein [Alloacidobacterium sp.]
MTTTAHTSEVMLISISLLDPSPVNPRKHFDEAQLAELATSIKQMGITNPITVRPGWSPVGGDEQRYEIIAGERRFQAAKLAGLGSVPAIIRELSDAEALDYAVVDNLQRVDLSPMEEAEGYKLLIEQMGWNGGSVFASMEDHASTVALKAGKTLRYVVQRIKLLSLIPEAQDVMRQGFLSLEVALLIARLQPEDQERAIVFAVDYRKSASGKTVAEKLKRAIANIQGSESDWYRVATEKEVREWIANNITLSLKDAAWALDDAALVPTAGACTSCPKRVGSNAVLFGDLTSKEDTCTDPRCYEAKKKAFVKLTVKEAAESGSTVLKLSTSRSTLPIKEGSVLEKTTFKQGQWVEAKKGSCPDTHRGVTEEGVFKTVCVNQKCKTHKHEITQPADRRSSPPNENSEERRKAREAGQKAYMASEPLIRKAVYDAIKAKPLTAVTALKLLLYCDPGVDEQFCQAHAIQPVGKDWERWRRGFSQWVLTAPAEKLTAVVLDRQCFDGLRVYEWHWERPEGDREELWEVAKFFGIDADGIAKSLSVPATVQEPKKDIEKPAKKGAHAKPVRLSPEAKKRIAAAQKARFAKLKPAKKAAKKGGKA